MLAVQVQFLMSHSADGFDLIDVTWKTFIQKSAARIYLGLDYACKCYLAFSPDLITASI